MKTSMSLLSPIKIDSMGPGYDKYDFKTIVVQGRYQCLAADLLSTH
jgi:hypothetical protein